MRMTRLILPLTISISIFASAQPTAPAHTPWQMQESGTTAGLRGIDSVDGTVAWASGTNGTVLKTLDGGAHWQKCAVPDAATDSATLDFRGVQAWDAQTAIVMASGPGEKSRLYKTTDGCKTWKLVFKNPDTPDGFFDSFTVDWVGEQGSLFGWIAKVLGDPVRGRFVLFETFDSGKTWKRKEDSGLSLEGANLAAFAASNSLIPQDEKHSSLINCFGTGGKSGAIVWWTFPAYGSWRKESTPIAHGSDSAGIFSMSYRLGDVRKSVTKPCDAEPCIREEIGMEITILAVGGDYLKPTEATGTVAWKKWGSWQNDDGTWTASTTPPHGFRSAVQWSENLKLWITVGTNGSDISRDDGKTWQPLDNGNWNALSLPFVVAPTAALPG
jgi:photosystem II stability/assembly factor-like uncharacterized protein